MAEILQLTKLIEYNRVTDVNVRCRGIQTELAAQLGAGRLGAGQLLLQFAFDQKRVGTAGNRGHCLLDFGRDFVFLFFGTGGFNRHRWKIPKKRFHSTAARHSQQTERYCTEGHTIRLGKDAGLLSRPAEMQILFSFSDRIKSSI